jgi:hypothetical protein
VESIYINDLDDFEILLDLLPIVPIYATWFGTISWPDWIRLSGIFTIKTKYLNVLFSEDYSIKS